MKQLTGYPSVDKPWLKYYGKEAGEVIQGYAGQTVYQQLYENNKNYQNDIALEYFGTNITYKKLFERIDSTAKALLSYGVKKGDFVTICSMGIPEAVYAFYALSKIGVVANMISPFFGEKNFIDRLEECKSDILIIMDSFYEKLKPIISKTRIKMVIVIPVLNSSLLRFFKKKYKIDKSGREIYWNDFILKSKAGQAIVTAKYEQESPAAVVYSSGTTGASKGILLSDDSFVNSVKAYGVSGIDVRRNQKFYDTIPMWYSTGLSTSLHLPLVNGATVFMEPRYDRRVFVKNVFKSKANYLVAATSLYEGFLEEQKIPKKSLSFLLYPFEGGETLSENVARKVEKVFREHGCNAKLRVGYGQCECGATVTTQIQGIEHPSNSVGIPLPGVTLGIFDGEFHELKYNERGYLWVNTPCGMIGYYKNAEATDKYFHVDVNGVKWNNVGDIAYIDENGNLFVLGRASDYTIVSGQKIYNFDVEKIVSDIAGIKDCDVVERKSKTGEIQLAAHLILEEEFEAEVKIKKVALQTKLREIQNAIDEKTQNEKMIPQAFKIRTEFPVAKSGKRDVETMKRETDGFIEVKWKKN